MLPIGSIIWWPGAAVDIPAGWVACEGSDSTPDLRNLFVVGAGRAHAVGDVGGGSTLVIPSHSHDVGTLALATDGGHDHEVNMTLGDETPGLHTVHYGATVVDDLAPHDHTVGPFTVDGGDHLHTSDVGFGSTLTQSDPSLIPACLALYFIQRVS